MSSFPYIFRLIILHNRVTLVLPYHFGTLNDSRYNNSSTEAEVLVAITSHGPTFPVGGTCYLWREVTLPPPLFLPLGGARSRLLIRRLLIHELVVPQPLELALVK
ncbi:hypothetical protein AVEN_99429-1 [Araneus ventricosus]|uniref:Uncharacterized protein n=1 Tax=Araneus ventricosus TaxID=182803 RepID=A0A4Y2MCI4_ARAVE|nr:hypothetical protein AVEN_99429-1 [Araneus ventricosus]